MLFNPVFQSFPHYTEEPDSGLVIKLCDYIEGHPIIFLIFTNSCWTSWFTFIYFKFC